MIDVSIIIVSYNTKELLANCLKSINESSKNLNVEIFVVDNNSQDKTPSYIKEKFPKVNLIANKKNLGFSKANNLAIEKATGKYTLILNPDTILMPDTLSKMKNYMDQSDKEIAVSTCRVELASGNLDKDCRRLFPTPQRALYHFLGLSKLFPRSRIFDQYYMGYVDQNTEHEIDACVGAFMFIRTDIFKKVGNFDEDYFFYGEDLDLCYRIKAVNYKIMFTPITKIIHLKGASSGIKKHSSHISKSSRESKILILKESTRAMELFYKKNLSKDYSPIITFFILLAVKIVERIRILRLTA